MKVNVIALEGSGRNWVQSLFAKHPQLEIWGESFPCFGWPNRYYPTPVDGADALIVIVRDKNCQEASVNRRGFHNGVPEGMFTPEISLAEVTKQIELARAKQIPIHFFDYEAALLYRQVYMNWFFESLGLVEVPIKTEWKDENRKNFRDESHPPLHPSDQEA